MSQLFDPFIGEIDQEADATRRVLERVPTDKSAWRPHEKSMTLGQLAHHVATIPGNMTQLFVRDSIDVSEIEPTPPAADSTDELLRLLDESLGTTKEILRDMADDQATGTWKVTAGDQTVMEVPRIGCIRSFTLNHWYHHRAQLGVYLRLLNVPVPSTYGPTADENPLEQMMSAAKGGAA